jgi:hypothetical protein
LLQNNKKHAFKCCVLSTLAGWNSSGVRRTFIVLFSCAVLDNDERLIE